MKTSILYSLLSILSIAYAYGQYNEHNLSIEPAGAQITYRYKHLQLYPVRANEAFLSHHSALGDYVALDEALKEKKVIITEYMEHNRRSSSGGVVNTLQVENVSEDTVMILAGEVVQGGKQDRMVAEDILLYPKSGKKEVSVFCVEHGRWRPRGGDMSFTGYYTISSNEVRKAGAVKKDQREVWDKVAETTEKNEAKTATGTLAALKGSGTFDKQLKEYTAYFQQYLLQDPDVIGVVAVSGDVILGCDMFATHAIFAGHYTNLLHSYAAEAITSGKDVTVSYEQVKKYLHAILGDETKQESEIKEKGTMLKEKHRKIHIATF